MTSVPGRHRAFRTALVTVTLTFAVACSSSDGASDGGNDEFCVAFERSLSAGDDPENIDDVREFEAASIALAAVEPPAAIADEMALLVSLDDGTVRNNIVDEEKYADYQAADAEVRAYLIAECGLPDELVNASG